MNKDLESIQFDHNSLVVRAITVSNFGPITEYEGRFGTGTNVVDIDDAKLIAIILALATKSKTAIPKRVNLDKVCSAYVNDKTHITVEIYEGEVCHLLSAKKCEEGKLKFEYDLNVRSYLKTPSNCLKLEIETLPEEDELQMFSLENMRGFEEKFVEYLGGYNEDTSYLSSKTYGLSDTKFFRRNLREYILREGIEKFNYDGKETQFQIKDNGKCLIKPVDTRTEGIRIIKNYIAFLKANEFIGDVATIRDFNHIQKPLFVYDLLSRFDGTTKDDLLAQADSLARQVFFIA